MIFRERHEIGADEIRGSMRRLTPGDRQLLYQIVRRGGDLAQTTHILAYIYFPTADGAQAAADALGPAFSRVRIMAPIAR